MDYSFLVAIVLAYVFGSIPTAVWIGKRFYNIDVREHGSGNAGATNTFRVLGQKAGIIVLSIDIVKGFLAVFLSQLIAQYMGCQNLTLLKILAGIFAVVGHIFPLFAGFRGGKGVATILGAVFGINPLASLIAVVVFLIVLIITKYVSVGSMMGGSTFPITVLLIQGNDDILMVVFSFLVVIMFIYTHWSNFKRLRNKTENKTYLFTPKKR
jgi:glycerol-3-phosphate acyltransferase PlsY